MKRTLLTIIVLPMLFFIIFLSGCTNDQVTPDEPKPPIEQPQPDDNIDNNERSNPPEEDNQDSDNEDLDNKDDYELTTEIKYYVNNNYYIKPVNPDDPTKVALLTFDDAPQGKFTTEILDILDKYEIKAIFFVNGHYAVKNKDLLKEIYERGHIIGNHTWWHENLKKIDKEKTMEEIIEVNNLVEEVTGERPAYFRPPFGIMSDYAKEVVAKEQMQRMNWSLGSLDWEYPNPEESKKVVEQVINNIQSGSNILMHDKEVTALALDEILSTLLKQGFSFILPTEVVLD